MDSSDHYQRTEGELTPSEIDLATAEICDRLARYGSACKERRKLLDGIYEREAIPEEEEEALISQADTRVRERFGIPGGVSFLAEESGYWNGSKTQINAFRPFISHWVRGVCYRAEMGCAHFYFEDCEEMDYLWVFLGQPSYYYERKSAPSDFAFYEWVTRWLRVGCRSKKRHYGKQFGEEFWWGASDPRVTEKTDTKASHFDAMCQRMVAEERLTDAEGDALVICRQFSDDVDKGLRTLNITRDEYEAAIPRLLSLDLIDRKLKPLIGNSRAPTLGA